MKQVWVKRATCSCTADTTRGAALPTLAGLRGTVIEVGAGNGLNFAHYRYGH